MITKILLPITGVLFALVLLLMGVFLVENNNADEQSKPAKEDMLIVYKKGEVIKVLPGSSHFQELKEEIENFVANANDAYRLTPSESRFNRLKKKGYAVELIYASSKELTISFLANPIRVNIIFIPLYGGGFPAASLFVYEASKDFPHILANTKQTKDKLLKLIESLNRGEN